MESCNLEDEWNGISICILLQSLFGNKKESFVMAAWPTLKTDINSNKFLFFVV